MARRVVQECDLTKQEYDPAETVTLVIKKNGKKTGRTYELSAAAASILEQQLVSGNKLEAGWGFSRNTESSPVQRSGRTLADLDQDEISDEDEKQSDAAFVADKKRDMREEGEDLEPREKAEDVPDVLPNIGADDSGCLHMNKGPIQVTQRAGKRHIYRTCRECRRRIPAKPKDDRSAFLNAKAPPETRAGHDPRIKDREK